MSHSCLPAFHVSGSDSDSTTSRLVSFELLLSSAEIEIDGRPLTRALGVPLEATDMATGVEMVFSWSMLW
jgi:hypothetical protein